MPTLSPGQGRTWLRWARLEPAAWCAFALAAALVQLPSQKMAPRLSNDAFQYLSAARQLGANGQMATELVHFDTERSHGVIPAPLTWFPPGYPLAIAAVAATGLSGETAALSISIACFVLVTAGVWRLARMLEPSLWAARGAVFLWAANSHALTFSVCVTSEPLFTALGVGGLLLLLRAGLDSARRQPYWAGAALLAGASYCVRYAGILWVGAFLLFALAQLVAAGGRKRELLHPAVTALALLAALVAPVMLRNLSLVGDWRGGNNAPSTLPFTTFVKETPKVLHHLALGDGTVAQLWFPLALVAAGAVGLCWLAFRAGGSGVAAPSCAAGWRLVAAAGLVYGCGIAAISMRTPIAYSPRMFVPALPHFAVMAACGAALLWRRIPARRARWASALAACAWLGYGVGNTASRFPHTPDKFETTAAALLGPDDSGASLQPLLQAELRPGEVIAATNGQAAGYILKHPTLSLVGSPYTALSWNAEETRIELARFGAGHLLVFRDAAQDPVVEESPFLKALASGQAPSWLRLAGSNRNLYVYRVELRPAAAPQPNPR